MTRYATWQPSPVPIVGVDGCRAGWIAAFAERDDLSRISIRVAPGFTQIVEALDAPSIVAVDMPIGLPDRIEGPGRAPERLVRPLLGERQSSVFSIPSRAAVFAPDYASACAEALASSNPPRKVSKQGFMIFPRIREIDMALRACPGLSEHVFESHPEVVFQALNGGPLPLPKKVRGSPHAPGLALRRRLLAAAGVPEDVLSTAPPAGARADDMIDALACLLTARAIASGRAQSWPSPPLRDAHGLPVAIWAPLAHDSVLVPAP